MTSLIVDILVTYNIYLLVLLHLELATDGSF